VGVGVGESARSSMRISEAQVDVAAVVAAGGGAIISLRPGITDSEEAMSSSRSGR
jgi:hypothetical protein